MSATHAQIARSLLATMPPNVFAYAAREGVINGDYTRLEQMLPGMKFASRKTGTDLWELVGTAADGSVCVWGVGA